MEILRPIDIAEIQKKRGIILYGGSFNPPHIGHVLFGAYLRTLFPLSELWIIPTYNHAFSKELSPFDFRLELLNAAFASMQGVVISDIERKLAQVRSYSIDLVRSLKLEQPNRHISVAIGSDLLPQLSAWREIEVLKELVDFIVFPRHGYDNSHALDLAIMPEVSSSELREALKADHLDLRLRGLIPARVLELWQMHHKAS